MEDDKIIECHILSSELAKLGKFLEMNQPSTIDEEAMELHRKRVGSLNTIWELINDIC